ncbi:ATP phosphoribosyltransferase regulatory subunit [Virgibacillus litoralis]|uniref:ATP phosphoribosyltransferase regulatory subunit n=1 Tax=Virgibacillus litoralis TaxID=578221 RepID=A0ABS4HCE1_9BACI|nr:ATP phosphoribosyltransferase regulatory subunit [Virgibacillus litoralis]MBP1948513.1 ATP phosphoribosyltransferase regulatory subunit [Virgibacillus litoralis]
MDQYLFESTKDTSVEDFQIRDNLISILKNRFSTYGYKQVRTTTFEFYDLYSTMAGTINKDEMLKVIDSSGKVLVLRPDVTIPITRMIASNKQPLSQGSRFFYVLDVFRQSAEQADNKETTQAGIESFGESTPENDAEVIALAIHTLKDLGFESFKLEVGHAGYFKELVNQLALSQSELDQLKGLIQSKNLTEIGPFLERLSIDKKLCEAVQEIPLLYGDPEDVIKRAGKIALNEKMQQKIKNLSDIYDVLKAYGVDDSVIFDLGLINNMNYYSGVIFQGFVASFGKPVLMGGRYDQLAEHFDTSIPAIGFACEVDNLLYSMTRKNLIANDTPSIDMIICYEDSRQKDALLAANTLREAGYRIITYTMDDNRNIDDSGAKYIAYFQTEENLVIDKNRKTPFTNYNELELLLQEGMRDN